MVAYTDDTFVARKQRHPTSFSDKKIMHHADDKKGERNIVVATTGTTKERKNYELGDLNPRRGLSGDIAVYHYNNNNKNHNERKHKWKVRCL